MATQFQLPADFDDFAQKTGREGLEIPFHKTPSIWRDADNLYAESAWAPIVQNYFDTLNDPPPPASADEIDLERDRRLDLILSDRDMRNAYRIMIKGILAHGTDINLWPAEKKTKALAWNAQFAQMELVDDAAEALILAPPSQGDESNPIHWP